MSVRDNLRKVMYDVVESQLAAEYGSAVKVAYENQQFEQPKDDPFLMCWFKYLPSQRAAIGTTKRFNRHQGFFVIDVVVPEKTGSKIMWQLADALVNIFEAKTFTLADCSYATTNVPSVTNAGKTQDGYYIVNVMVPFILDAAPR